MKEEQKQKLKVHATVSTRRAQLARTIGQSHDGERDLYDACGYPDDLVPNDYVQAYNRQDIAARIVDAYPDATWNRLPEIKGDKLFIQGLSELEKRLQLFRAFHRLDRLMGLGHYGVLLLGLDGGEQMSQPANGRNYQLLYVQPHSERTAQVSKWDDDPNSPRYGKPLLYNIQSGVEAFGAGAGQKALTVHYSRVIHVAERALEDEAIGTPRLERVWNRLMDVDKMVGGFGEIYWQNAAMIMAFVAQPDVEWDPEESTAMAEQIEEMQNGLRRFLRLRGVDAQQLAPGLQGSDPNNGVDKALDLIAGASGVPKRILLGSERGELASSQDETNWGQRITERREQLAIPAFVESFIKVGLKLGFLQGNFTGACWPQEDVLGEEKRSAVTLQKAQAIATYVNTPGAEMLVPEEDFRSWLGLEGEVEPLPLEEPLDETDIDVVEGFEEGLKPQDTGLNGAQIKAIQEIAAQVSARTLPAQSAKAILSAAFPVLDAERIDAIIDPIVMVPPTNPEV